MLKIVSKLFQERTNIIRNQTVLAKNLNKQYKLSNNSNTLREYRKIKDYQRQISEKENQIYQVQLKKIILL